MKIFCCVFTFSVTLVLLSLMSSSMLSVTTSSKTVLLLFSSLSIIVNCVVVVIFVSGGVNKVSEILPASVGMSALLVNSSILASASVVFSIWRFELVVTSNTSD